MKKVNVRMVEAREGKCGRLRRGVHEKAGGDLERCVTSDEQSHACMMQISRRDHARCRRRDDK